ncbi:MAG TPA: biotin-dependent carboxyltransferase family protein [Candidatus Limnocylindrales bacterium]|nr:biotin-dependent carboxyltransferase family protein [Candidatus Limnocylindrales bacterium]
MIEVLEPGAFTTVQDRGRPGFERFGISPGGPVDWFAARAANHLCGNHEDAALLECTLVAPTLRFHAPARIATTGGAVGSVPMWTAHAVAGGHVLALGRIRPGLRTYVAVRGGLDVQPVLGSRAVCQLGRFGGGFGRPLRAGDRLPIGAAASTDPAPSAWPAAHRLPLHGPWEVRAIPGPHDGVFPPQSLRRLCDTALRVTPRIDRMGMRLESPALRLQPEEIVTTGVPVGAIQVTPSGELIILLAEHQTTGGYPVIATVIGADLPLLAQARPGDTIHLRLCGLDEARRAHRRLDAWFT